MKKQSVLELLYEQLAAEPDRVIYTFVNEGKKTNSLTIRELAEVAELRAGRFQAAGLVDKPVLMPAHTCTDFVCNFYAALMAGVIAIPVPPVQSSNKTAALVRLRAIALATQAEFIIDHDLSPSQLDEECDWSLASINPQDLIEELNGIHLRRSGPAYLQFTSGSTGNPKGVVISHECLADNVFRIQQNFKQQNDIIVSWLPLFHDMGLVGILLASLTSGVRSILMPPEEVVRSPSLWLRAMSDYGATTTAAPSYGYALAARRCRSSLLQELDLSRLSLALCGSEPVIPSALKAFSEKFEASGFAATAFRPVYGLAEATLLVSSPDDFRPAIDGCYPKSSQDVSCGKIVEDHLLIIVDPVTRTILSEGTSGEIWISGPSVACGYWNNADETASRFDAQLASYPGKRFLRTGDIGRLVDQELYVEGRLSDVIIIGGSNYHAVDIETEALRSSPRVREGKIAAFEIQHSEGSELTVALETRKSATDNLDSVATGIAADVRKGCGVSPSRILFFARNSLPRTSSGKIRRPVIRQQYLSGELKPLYAWSLAQAIVRDGLEEFDFSGVAQSKTDWKEQVELFLKTRLSVLPGVSAEGLSNETRLSALGLDSVVLLHVRDSVEATFQVTLGDEVLFDDQSLGSFASHIVDLIHNTASGDQESELELEELLSESERVAMGLGKGDHE